MVEKEYTAHINNLKISGSAEDIHKLANVYGLAACEYGNAIVEEIQGEHRDDIIAERLAEQRILEGIEKQLIDVIRNSDYYKKFSAEMSAMIDEILQEIES